MEAEWKRYWNELSAEHNHCLDYYKDVPTSDDASECSRAQCEPYHSVGSKDVDVRTVIRACFAAAKDIEDQKNAEEVAAKESEKQKQIEAAKK